MTARSKASAIERLRAVAFWGLVVCVAGVMGLRASGEATAAAMATGPTWGEHLDLVQTAIVLLFGLGVWSARRQLSSIEKKFDLLFDWKTRITTQVDRLQGEHDVMARGCKPPRRRHEDMDGD